MPFLSQIENEVKTSFQAEVSDDLHHLARIAMLQLKQALKEHLNKSEDELTITSEDECGLNHATYFGMMVGKEVHEQSLTIKDHLIFVSTETSGQKIAKELVRMTNAEVTEALEPSNAHAIIPK